MLIASKHTGHRRDGRRLYFLDFGGDAPPPPDYTPVAQASKEAAEISAKLGQAQLDEAKRQYDNNMAVAQPVVNAQLQVMQQGIQQGNDYYNYQKGFRPLEQAMLAQVSGISADDMARVQQMRTEADATARTSWEQQQAARRTQLQQQIAAEQQTQAQAQAAAQAQAQAQASAPQFYVDAQGNVRTADAYKGLQQADPAEATKSMSIGRRLAGAPQSPGEGFSYFEYDNPNFGKDNTNGGEGWSIDTDRKAGVWLKTQGGAAPASAAPQPGTTTRASELQAQLDALDREQFSGAGDYTAADAEQQRLTMAGTAAKQARDKAEIDAITGEVRTNAQGLLDRTRAYEGQAAADIALATGGNRGIADKYASDIEYDVGRAVADARVGQTSALNTAARQAARYGIALPSAMQPLTNQNAAQLAAAANNTRDASTDKYRGLVMQGIGLKRDAFTTGQAATMDAQGKAEGATRAGRDMRIQQESLDWAKQLDVTGMARGMPGASQGAYGVAVSAGNSATQNQMAPGNALMGAMAQSNQTQMSGQQLAMQGLTSILGNQTSYANSSGGGADAGGVGALLGGAASLYKSGIFSDRRLKQDITLVGRDERTGLNLYEFAYINSDGTRFRGVMADEVEARFPDAVVYDDLGFATVNYQMLGIDFKEVK